MCSVAREVPLRSIDDVKVPSPLALVVTVGSSVPLVLVLWLVSVSAQFVAEGFVETCVEPETALERVRTLHSCKQ